MARAPLAPVPLLLLLLAAAAAAAAAAGCSPGAVGGAGDGADGGPATLRRARVTGTGGVGLNLREEPSVDATVDVLMPEGAVVDLLSGPDDGWDRVRYAGHEGFAYAEYLVEIDPNAPDAGEPAGHGGLLELLPYTPGTSHVVTRAHGNTGGHTGITYWAWDFSMPVGTPVLAAHDGVVRAVRGDSDRGCCDSSCDRYVNYVVLDRGDGTESLYLHLSAASVEVGQQVTRGQRVGKSGETGWACGAHLHFQMQHSPSGGGTSSFANQSIHAYFHDTGEAFDPGPGDEPVSHNGTIDVP
jgi:murein DD-endopeptidase MepM/ murein hydrolase activator NlpD